MSYEIAGAIIFIGLLWFLSVIAVNMPKEHSVLKLLFILVGLWLTVVTLNFGLEVAEASSAGSGIINSLSTAYKGMIIVSGFTTFYYIIYYFKTVIDWLSKKMKFKKTEVKDYEASF